MYMYDSFFSEQAENPILQAVNLGEEEEELEEEEWEDEDDDDPEWEFELDEDLIKDD